MRISRTNTRAAMTLGLILLFILPVMLLTGGFEAWGGLLLVAGVGGSLANSAVFYCAASSRHTEKAYGKIFAPQMGLAQAGPFLLVLCIVALSFCWNLGLILSTAEIAHADPSGRAVPLVRATVGLGDATRLITLGASEGGADDAAFLWGAADFVAFGAGLLSWLIGLRKTAPSGSVRENQAVPP
ncbi:hypothetical protein [Roseobacter weihaiensis]|uniref:hypothetical protein n=1 Tax=Roseobacter weihaiensis TaxID=2763262 RepID=UPI001D0B1425|nr:hypothetical protein [Roseobacter sp. H9]